MTDGRLVPDEDIDALLEGVTADPTPNEVVKPSTKISHSLERLSHFQCGECNGWWSIGDWSAKARGRKTLYCPWCGTLQEVAA